MKEPPALMVWLYRCAMFLYPLRLRLEYREQLLQTLRDAYRDREGGVIRFWARMFGDLMKSSVMQRLYLGRSAVLENPVIYYALALAIMLSLLGGAATVVIDQMMRVGEGDQPQTEMANWYAGEIGAGVAPADEIPPGYVDLATSLQPFVIFYDEQGRPTNGTGYIDQELPTPPAIDFDEARKYGTQKDTWEPMPGVRLAAVIRRVDIKGKASGFIVTGRSLRVIERQKDILWWMALGIWFAMMLLLIGGAKLLRRMQRVTRIAA